MLQQAVTEAVQSGISTFAEGLELMEKRVSELSD